MDPVVKDFSSVLSLLSVTAVDDSSSSELQGRCERKGFAGALEAWMRACRVQRWPKRYLIIGFRVELCFFQFGLSPK